MPATLLLPLQRLLIIIGCSLCLVISQYASAREVSTRAVADTQQLKTIVVAQDGSGNYTSIQQAINAVRDLYQWQVTIFIKNGTYKEKIIVPSWKTNIRLLGESNEHTIITWDDYSGKSIASGKDATGSTKFSTYTSATLLVQADDFTAENLCIVNSAGRVGQAVALHVEGDRAVIRNCRIIGNQDTLYTARSSSQQYYDHCYIEGTTDFIFGEATCVFESCTIKNLTNSYITAAATTQQQRYGYVFFRCKLIADTGVTKAYLGRPWRPYAKTVFLYCDLGAHITPEGWNAWKGDAMFPEKEKTAFYAEYQNTGAGAKTAGRVAWSKQLKKRQARNFTPANIFDRAMLLRIASER